MNEAQFQNTVIDLAQKFGWKVAHFRSAQTAMGWRTPVQADGAGFPDLLMVRDKRCVVAELKSATGRLSDAQYDWLRAFGDVGVDAYTWYPRDLGPTVEESVIMETLK